MFHLKMYFWTGVVTDWRNSNAENVSEQKEETENDGEQLMDSVDDPETFRRMEHDNNHNGNMCKDFSGL